MRVLLLNYEFPPLGGGAATASAQIAKHMAGRGVDVVVLTSAFRGLPRREEHNGYTICRVPTMRRTIDRCTPPEMGAYVAGAMVPALRLASKFRPNLMHVFFGVPTGAVGLVVHKLKGIPYLLSLRGGDVPGFMGKELANLHRATMPLTRQVWGHAGAIVANSIGLHELAQRTVPGRKIEIVPNGVDLDTFVADHAARGEHTKTRLLFVGRLANQKGLTYLLKGLSKMPSESRARVELELVGSGPEEGSLRQMSAEMGLRDIVRFAGWVPRNKIVKQYQSADLFVLPSLDEGLPNVVLEAMSCGLPILATDISGNREIVHSGENGLLVPAADVDALSVALHTLISSPSLRKRMGTESRKVAAQYSWAATADRYLELSENIVATSRVQHEAGHKTRREAY